MHSAVAAMRCRTPHRLVCAIADARPPPPPPAADRFCVHGCCSMRWRRARAGCQARARAGARRRGRRSPEPYSHIDRARPVTAQKPCGIGVATRVQATALAPLWPRFTPRPPLYVCFNPASRRQPTRRAAPCLCGLLHRIQRTRSSWLGWHQQCRHWDNPFSHG